MFSHCIHLWIYSENFLNYFFFLKAIVELQESPR